jgi:acyl-CoA dehydrogenase
MPENLTPELLSIKEKARVFIFDEISEWAESITDDTDPASLDSLRQRVRERSRELGFFYKTQPSEHGGSPATTLELIMLTEMMASANQPLTDCVFGPGPGILAHAEAELKEQYLDPVLRGEKKGAFGFTEPDTAERPTWAVHDGNYLVINGCKSYVTGGDTADFVSVLVNVQRDAGGEGGTAMVVVDRDAEGLVIDRRFNSLDGSHHVSMTLIDVRVPVSHIIGKIGEGMPRALGTIGNVRLMIAAQAVGMCQWTIKFVADHLKAPHRSGTPLGQREGIRLRYADTRIETYAARSMLYRTARLVDSGENSVNETIATKVYCTELVGRVVDTAVQLVGGQALVEGHPLALLYRRVRAMRLMEGASDLLRLNLVKGEFELKKGRL